MALLKVCQKSPVLIRKCNMKKSSIPPYGGISKESKTEILCVIFFKKTRNTYILSKPLHFFQYKD